MRTLQIKTQEHAEAVVGPFRPVLREAIEGAFADWDGLLQGDPNRTLGLTAFTRTRFIHDRIVYRLAFAETQGDAPGLRLRKIRGLHVAILNDQVMLKLKKLDARLRSRNIQTKQTIAFDTQSQIVRTDFGRMTNATGGYVADAGAGEIASIVVVAWNGDKQLWVVDLLQDVAATGGVVVTVPAEAAPATTRTRVVAERPAVQTDEPG